MTLEVKLGIKLEIQKRHQNARKTVGDDRYRADGEISERYVRAKNKTPQNSSTGSRNRPRRVYSVKIQKLSRTKTKSKLNGNLN